MRIPAQAGAMPFQRSDVVLRGPVDKAQAKQEKQEQSVRQTMDMGIRALNESAIHSETRGSGVRS